MTQNSQKNLSVEFPIGFMKSRKPVEVFITSLPIQEIYAVIWIVITALISKIKLTNAY